MLRCRWVPLLVLLASTGCGDDAPVGPTGQTGPSFDPSAPGPGFTPARTQAERQSLVQDMWSILTAPACWDASAIVQATQPVGIVAQFQFHSSNQYRFYGTTTFFGTIVLHDVGHYQGLQTAIVETWTGEIEAIVIADPQEMVHLYPHLDGSITELVTYASPTRSATRRAVPRLRHGPRECSRQPWRRHRAGAT